MTELGEEYIKFAYEIYTAKTPIDNINAYYREIKFPTLGDSYKVVWNVDKATQIIKREKMNTSLMDINEFHIPFDELDKKVLESAIHNKKPAIAVHLPALDFTNMGKILIDGSHRTAAKLKQANAKKNINPKIKAYVLDEELCYECMSHEFFRVLTKVHYNLGCIGKAEMDGTAPNEVKGNLYTIK